MNRIKKAIIWLMVTLAYISVTIVGFIILMGLYIIPILDNL